MPEVIEKAQEIKDTDVFLVGYSGFTAQMRSVITALLDNAKSLTAVLVEGENEHLFVNETADAIREICASKKTALSQEKIDSDYLLESKIIAENLFSVQKKGALKEKIKTDKIRVLCGVEQDYYSNCSTDGFDYVIGSVHYFFVDGEYFHVDHSEEYFLNSVKTAFGGDFYSAAENYYSAVSNVIEKTGADIIGHFDLMNKFNKDNKFFDVKHPRYVDAYTKALEKLLKTGKVFEINTGVISRGYRKQPYPHTDIYNIIKDNGGKFVLSSDAHSKENIAYEFSKWQKLI